MCHTVYGALECRHYNKTKFTGEQTFRNTLYKLFVWKEYHNKMNQRREQDLLLLIKEGDDTYSYWYETGGPTNCSVSRL
ncbi:hypothetical protein NOF04DRAFT_1348417 [Fusarium oxysporum II5]|nr:hypothetical protein NOF04DRAFT_1348417 [Fusarium oxysporum II5]